MENNLIPWIIALPFASAIAIGLSGRFSTHDKLDEEGIRKHRGMIHTLAVGSVGLSFLIAVKLFIELHNPDLPARVLTSHVFDWFDITIPSASGFRDVPIAASFVLDSLSGLMTLVVTGIGTLIHLYATGYMEDEESYARFFCYLNLFTASMLILVLGSNFPLMFVGWEGVGLCSYLLIGFWYETPEYAAAGRKAFVANRIGDLGVLVGMFALVSVAGSFEFSEINRAASMMNGEFTMGGVALGTTATVACLFLFLGCTGKSAQVPLFVWLPDAMAGPTPVSALIHAATMVTAGVYLCCRLSPIFLESPTAMTVIGVVGSITALMAASIAVVQREMKRILAYSTVSQLGFMFAGVGVGAFSAGFFHVFTHAFFKACLFLGAGSVMHAVHAHGDADIFKLGGMKKYTPITRATFLLSTAAIAGFPLTAGFFSKDELLLGATTIAMNETALPSWLGWLVAISLFLAATMTAFYMFRLYYLTFTGDYRSADHGHDAHGEEGHDEDAHHDDDHHDHAYDAHPHESSWQMWVPLAVLAFGAIAVGFLGLPHAFHLPNWWGHWMDASISHLPGFGPDDEVTNMTPVYIAMTLGVAAWAIGMGLATVLYREKNEDTFTPKFPKPVFNFLFDKWRVDEAYEATIIGGNRGLAKFAGRIDKSFVDTVFTGIPAFVVKMASWLFTRIQVGAVHAYGAVLLVGVLGLGWWFMYPHPTLDVQTSTDSAEITAAPGLGYTYRFDMDDDGNFDFPQAPQALEIDFEDDASRMQIQRVVARVRAAIAPVRWPNDRSALGHLKDRNRRIYELHPPTSEIADLQRILQNVDGVEAIHWHAAGHERVFGDAGNAAFDYNEEDFVGYMLTVAQADGSEQEMRVLPELTIIPDSFFPRVQFEGSPPRVGFDENGRIKIFPTATVNDAGEPATRPDSVLVGGVRQDEPFLLGLGSFATVAQYRMEVFPIVRARVEVRNAFGNTASEEIEIVLKESAPERVALGGEVRR